jgi:hypothetical protein
MERIGYVEWSPVVAGAIAAAAVALVLHAFAVAIGLSVSSTAPTWRDASFTLVLLSGLATAQSLTHRAAPSGGQAGSSTSVGGENFIAYDLDRLFRAERRTNTDLDYPRAEAARILLTTSSHRGMQPEDRGYLVRLTAAYTGLAQPDAERRVDEAAARAKENISRVRRTAVILAFMTGAAAMVGAAASWFAACAGGRVRDGEVSPHALLDWGKPVRRI